MIRFTYILLSAFVVSCAASAGPAASADPGAGQRLDDAMKRRDELERQFAENPAGIRERCELTAGDCMIQLRERRGALLEENEERVLACPRSNDLDVRLRCAAKMELPRDPAVNAKDPTPEFAEYYRDEGKCWEELVQCTATLKKEAAVAAEMAKERERRHSIETSGAAVAARNAVATTSEQIKYIRLTLPVESDEICPTGEALPACLEQAQIKLAEWEPLAAQAEGFDAQAATAAYVAGKQAEAACHKPELECLMTKLSDFGGTAETRQLLERNLALIEERQQLSGSVKEAIIDRCVKDIRSRHQERILQRFQDYVGQPKLYFRFQLDRAFLALHTEQVGCLKKYARRGRRSPAK